MTSDAVYQEALRRFEELFAQGSTLGLCQPEAVALATADSRGRPSVRIVLLRGQDERGFVFFTNSESRKGEELEHNPRAALCFYWDAIGRQVRVEGPVEKVTDAESDEYWGTRPRESQISSSVSLQSRVLPERAAFEQRVAELDREFAGRSIPRPAHWFGYRVAPDRIEFWSNRDARMHDRTVFEVRDEGWVRYMLYP